MRQQNERPPARGARIKKNSGYSKGSTFAAAAPVDGRARFLADATARAFAAGVRFAVGRLADLAQADAETLAAYRQLLRAASGGRR
jgi:hypothetical protein